MTDAPPCPKKLTCLLSGGKDSITTACWLSEQGKLDGCLFIDTGIKTPDVLPFVEKTCEEFGWSLEVRQTPIVYEDIVLKYGFPGPPLHGQTMNYLKGRPVAAWRRGNKGKCLASGVRVGESKRRLNSAKEWSKMEGAWVNAPILDWSTERVWDYVRERGLPVSPAYKTLHLSGDCLCGAFAGPEEADIIKMFYPETAERLKKLEAEVAKKHSGYRVNWGHGIGFRRKVSSLEDYLCGACETDFR